MAEGQVITLDEATHIYRVNGEIKPSVHEIMGELRDFSDVREDVLARAADRGQNVHLATRYLDEGRLDEESVFPAFKGYVDAHRKFLAENSVDWYAIEEPLYHPVLQYCGTPDRYGMVNGRIAVADLKTTVALYPAFGVQLHAYGMLAHENYDAYPGRLAIQLRKDGTYRLKWYEYVNDGKTDLDPLAWSACLNIYRWRERNKGGSQ